MDEWIDCPRCRGWTSTETGMEPRLAELRDDIALTQCIEILTRSVLDIVTGEPLFDDARPDLYAADVRSIVSALDRLRTARIAARRS